MTPRFNLAVAPDAVRAMRGLEAYLKQSGLDLGLLHLIKVRASQVNGCAYCLDMHWKEARAAGESEQRLYGLDAWRESPYYTDRERAVLGWTEAVTDLKAGHVPDAAYEALRGHFGEKEVADLTWAVAAINAWNRLLTASRTEAGTYKAGQQG